MTHDFRFDTAFEAQAARTPDDIALRFADRAITYGELDARANRVANELRAAGIASGSFVGLYAERSIDSVAAMLGILKVDAAVVPLPPSWPPDRLNQILRHGRFDAVIDAESTRLITTAEPRTLRLENALTTGSATAPPPVERGGNSSAAFVICSSGSTGTPKMIVRSHRSFLHRLEWTWAQHPYSAGDVCVQKSFQATTHAVYELFEPLLRGVAVRIVADESLRDLASFWELLAQERVTRLLIVPSMLQASLDLPGFVPPPLRVLVLMGEHVPAALAARAAAAFPASTKIFSIYGSSEASSTLVTDLRSSSWTAEDPPLGKPISPDVGASVLDADLQPVAPGGIGMLHISGSPLFSGYFRNAEGTEAVHATLGSERLYRTADQVRVLSDGSFLFVGRADDVVKLRGFRVDLGEVERWLSRAPGVRLCVVAPYPDATSATTLLAFVTPSDVETTTAFAWLRSQLPAYMLPSAIVPLERFPQTPSGKIDRRRLVADYRGAAARSPAVSYESDTERAIATVWCELLQVQTVERDRSFFEIGGTSLTVFAAAHRLREMLGLKTKALGATTLYTYPTVATLAAAIDRGTEADAETVLVPLRQGDGSGRPPLFVVSSAGGTLGAYEKVVRALRTPRDVIGLRDPFLAGDRDPTEGFQRWVRRYTEAIRRRQPRGPYNILAYSSAGAFGYEIAQQLRAVGDEVALLALVDPVGMDYASRLSFGHWALPARFMSGRRRRIVRRAGMLRALVPRALRAKRTTTNANDWTLSAEEFEAHASWSTRDRDHILRFAALLELNTGRPFAIQETELDAIAPSLYLDVLLTHVARVDASIDPDMIRRALVQYDLQVKSQHHYRPQRYDGAIYLFDADGPFSGLEAAQLRPYVRRLHARSLPFDGLSARERELLGPFPEGLRAHYGCMRNDKFTERLAAELSSALEASESKGV
ncbi:MAG TPA: AMP-binding protein [Gemmatimonadaceae bacterium]|jgi:amino acid adenylation domain-containing protein|nr:AMP-binding protein [Gemmatimonadaceae bacterium]